MNFLACTNLSGDGSSTSSTVIKEGDCVIVYEGINSMKAVYVSSKGRYENRYGVFTHKSWIGKNFGSKVTANMGGSGWIYLLRPTPELWTQVLRHRTQILYIADISMVVMHLGLRPGSVVLESGTGSGSLTHSLVRAVAPTGHVHTFEFHAGRAEDAAAEFKQHGLSGQATVAQRNIEEQGFPDSLHNAADGVFLDLPGPHKVVPSAAACLRPNGRFCSFSPCIEQVQRTVEALSAAGFTDLITYECLLREYEVHREALATSISLTDPPAAKRRRPESSAATQPPAAPAPAAEAPAATHPGDSKPADGTVNASATADASTDVKDKGSEPTAVGAAEVGSTGSGEEVGGVGAGASGASTEPQEQQQQQPVTTGPGSRPVAVSAPLRIVSFRPSLEARGHTGYLTFARKFVCG